MAESYDGKNGYNSSDFKRNANQDQGENEQDGVEGGAPKINEKAGEYMRELLSEKIKIDQTKFPMSTRLIDQEVTRVQTTGRIPPQDFKYVDVFREKPVKVTVKVLVPIKEHPKFNFVGKLLGPKGNTMKQLQEETMCKMAVLGRGSMRDRRQEGEFRNSLDPKYAHLSDELHVEISALAPPAEAHARIAYALAEVRKYLIPDTPDMMPGHGGHGPPMSGMRPDVPRPALLANPSPRGAPQANIQYKARNVTPRSFSYMDPTVVEQHFNGPRGGPMSGRGPPRMPHVPPPGRPMPKNKVFSILDRARSAMETYPGGYDDPYGEGAAPPVRGPPQRVAQEPEYYGYETRGGGSGAHDRYYEDADPYSYKEEPQREYKTSSRDVGTRRAAPQQRHFQQARQSPYNRQPKASQGGVKKPQRQH